MKTLKLMIVNENFSNESSGGEIILMVSKMSRLFYFSKDKHKHFSLNFPFRIREEDSGLIYYSYHISDIDSRVTSAVLGVLSEIERFDANCVLEFAELIEEFTGLIEEFDQESFWPFLRELFLHEDGYIRYDYDEKHENSQTHPLYHLDICYSPGNTFKFGLRKEIGEDYFIDILNTETNCTYLEKP